MLFLIVLTALSGALAAGVLGWLKTGEKFEWEKFTQTIISSLFAAVVFALSYSSTIIHGPDFLLAFLGGAGIDVVGRRLPEAAKQQDWKSSIQSIIQSIPSITTPEVPKKAKGETPKKTKQERARARRAAKKRG